MYIQGFDSAPAEGARAVAAEAFGEEGAWVGDVGEAGMHGVGAGVVDEVVDGLCVGAGGGA